jgi:hypothetical protein
VLRVHHRHARDIVIQGNGGATPASFVTFDDPHQLAGTVLAGEYPTGLLRWSDGQWKIGVPDGRFGTFNLARQGASSSASFAFVSPRVFTGIDVYNPSPQAASLELRCSDAQRMSVTISPDQLLRVRTGWQQPCASITIEIASDAPLRFDNLAYLP